MTTCEHVQNFNTHNPGARHTRNRQARSGLFGNAGGLRESTLGGSHRDWIGPPCGVFCLVEDQASDKLQNRPAYQEFEEQAHGQPRA